IVPVQQVSKFAHVANWTGIGVNGLEFLYNAYKAYDLAGEADLETQADYNLKALAALGGVGIGAALLIGGGPATLIVGGIGLAAWGFGTLGQYFTKNEAFARAVTAPMRAIKSGVNAVANTVKSGAKAVANAAKSAWNTVKGWFS